MVCVWCMFGVCLVCVWCVSGVSGVCRVYDEYIRRLIRTIQCPFMLTLSDVNRINCESQYPDSNR